MAQQKSHNYQLACVEHFKAVYPGVTPTENNFGNHPNAWFASSVKAGGDDTPTTEPTSSSPADVEMRDDTGRTLVSVSP